LAFVANEKENWTGPVALTSLFQVALPGIETEHLPGIMRSELGFRYVAFPFVTASYLRFRFRVLTASRVINPRYEAMFRREGPD
jgi:hypothetical protein